MVLVKWWGHACFEVRDEVVLVIDPHDGQSVNMDPPRVKADIVLVSHGHGDHASGRGSSRRQVREKQTYFKTGKNLNNHIA